MEVTDNIDDVERRIDEAYRSCHLLRYERSLGLWYLFAEVDRQTLNALGSDTTSQQFGAFVDNAIWDLNHAVSWIYHASPPGNQIPPPLDSAAFGHANDLLRLANSYSRCSTIFPLWRRGLVRIDVTGRQLKAEHALLENPRYEAYNRLSSIVEVSPEHNERFELLKAKLEARVQDGARPFGSVLEPSLLRECHSLVQAAPAPSYLLPEWDFSSYSIRDFRSVTNWLSAIVRLVEVEKSFRLTSGDTRSTVIGPYLITRSQLVRTIQDMSGLARHTVKAVVRRLEYGRSPSIRYPDPALQPLVPVTSQLLALTLPLVVYTSIERNHAVLLNMLPEERARYEALSQEKEAAMYERIVSILGGRYAPRRFRIPGRPDLPDLDLVLTDTVSRTIVVCELKWFIGPAEIRQTVARSEELSKGISQVKKLLGELRANRAAQAALLNHGTADMIAGCVVSANWIGLADVQDPEVPIISEKHFLSAVKDLGSLPSVVRWLQERRYLPREGVDFAVRDVAVRIGGYEISWYGIQALLEGVYVPDTEAQDSPLSG